jgi:hypothetical protein
MSPCLFFRAILTFGSSEMGRSRAHLVVSLLPRHLIIGLIVAGLYFASLWFLWLEPDRANTKWYRRIRSDVMELAHKRPPEVNCFPLVSESRQWRTRCGD